jgi:hypothetical protein
LGSSCVSCHVGDDTHEGQFGLRCEQCHDQDNWKKLKGRTIGSARSANVSVTVRQRSASWGTT